MISVSFFQTVIRMGHVAWNLSSYKAGFPLLVFTVHVFIVHVFTIDVFTVHVFFLNRPALEDNITPLDDDVPFGEHLQTNEQS